MPFDASNDLSNKYPLIPRPSFSGGQDANGCLALGQYRFLQDNQVFLHCQAAILVGHNVDTII